MSGTPDTNFGGTSAEGYGADSHDGVYTEGTDLPGDAFVGNFDPNQVSFVNVGATNCKVDISDLPQYADKTPREGNAVYGTRENRYTDVAYVRSRGEARKDELNQDHFVSRDDFSIRLGPSKEFPTQGRLQLEGVIDGMGGYAGGRAWAEGIFKWS